MLPIPFVLLCCAALCFLLATVNTPSPRIQLVPLGLLFATLAFLVR